jgi:hypothetical protein
VTPWIRDQGWVKNQDPGPGSVSESTSRIILPIFWGQKYLSFFIGNTATLAVGNVHTPYALYLEETILVFDLYRVPV